MSARGAPVKGQLALRYERLEAAWRRGDAEAARAALLAVVGLGEPSVAPPPRDDALATAPLVTFGTVRRADLLAVRAGARRAARFDDLPLRAAHELAERLRREGLQAVVGRAYHKRFDVVEASPGGPGAALCAVYVSRGEEAREVAEAELLHTPEHTRRAGLALGYPACCVEQFARTEAAAHEACVPINEAALRSMRGVRGPIPWELNPFATEALCGFTPCAADCAAALGFARGVLRAVRAADERLAAVMEQVLRRPILYFQAPLFIALDGTRDESDEAAARVRYARAVAQAPLAPSLGYLVLLLQRAVGAALALGDGVEVTREHLRVCRGAELVAHWPLVDAEVPLLLRFVSGERVG